MKKVAFVFADRMVFTSGANRRLSRQAHEIPSAFLVSPSLRWVLRRENSRGGSARLRPERKVVDRDRLDIPLPHTNRVRLLL